MQSVADAKRSDGECQVIGQVERKGVLVAYNAQETFTSLTAARANTLGAPTLWARQHFGLARGDRKVWHPRDCFATLAADGDSYRGWVGGANGSLHRSPAPVTQAVIEWDVPLHAITDQPSGTYVARLLTVVQGKQRTLQRRESSELRRSE